MHKVLTGIAVATGMLTATGMALPVAASAQPYGWHGGGGHGYAPGYGRGGYRGGYGYGYGHRGHPRYDRAGYRRGHGWDRPRHRDGHRHYRGYYGRHW